jgi:hypothetical protein
MNQEEYPIYPNLKRIVNICKFKYNVLEIKLFESVRVAVYLYNDKDILIEANQILIEGTEYNAWSNDDKYIINLIKTKIQTMQSILQ